VTQALRDLLATEYAAVGVRVSPLTPEPDGKLYRVDRVAGPPLVVRHFPADRRFADVEGDAEVLRLVRPMLVEQLVETGDGRAAARADGRGVIVTEFEMGPRATASPAVLEQLGATLGALPESGITRRAGALPREDLALARRFLAEIADDVPADQRDIYDRLDRDVRATNDCEDLPRTLVHSDCHLANAIHTDRGAVLLDWEGTGQGPAIAALGWLLYSAVVQSPEGPAEPFDPRRVAAVLTGYCRHRTLSDSELHRFADAIRFRPLVVAVREFHHSVVNKTPGSAFGWWSRYTEAETVADQAIAFSVASRR
jgi:Ser/Thr protein kinase RdoA (MazF antagonist)